MIYIIKLEGLYQYKVSSSLVSTCNCKMGYSEEKSAANAANPGKDVRCEIVAIFYTPYKRRARSSRLSLAHRACPLQVKSFLTILDEGRSKKKINLETLLAAFAFIILFVNHNCEKCLSTNSVTQEACNKKNPGTLNRGGA